MWLGLLFLLIVGAGRWSFDAALMRGGQGLRGRAHRDKRKKTVFCECPELIVKGKRISRPPHHDYEHGFSIDPQPVSISPTINISIVFICAFPCDHARIICRPAIKKRF